MNRLTFFTIFVLGLLPATAQNEQRLLSKVRQLTFEGKRSGEGYFSADDRFLIFQSEREADNPFYQIYLMDLETGDTERVSPGYGKTTCSWVHPGGKKAFFASTHLDPEARQKQQAEIELRASGQQRRYAWDYDEQFDLFEKDLTTHEIVRLTDSLGYDAEGSYSPDGQWIAFASNRHAYTQPLSSTDAEIFAHDKAYMLDIYIMHADGSGLKRLTSAPGYDGGPFFSADGSRICWRRFAPDGATAEIYTMNIDGSDQRKLTSLGAMSWAPYFHPSGDYLIFATNLQGFANFELYLVDAAGARQPVRVTDTDGFDGLPVFTHDGRSLAWTSTRTSDKTSQIFIAAWDDAAARALLGLGSTEIPSADLSTTSADIDEKDLRHFVTSLAADEMEGRLTGSEGEKRATAMVASVFQALGLEPAGDNGSWYQEFPFVAGVSLGEKNSLTLEGKDFKVDEDWRPLTFSKTGSFPATPVVFAGFGISAPAEGDLEEYDSYVHLDVKDKWVMVLRYLPENVSQEMRHHLNRHASLRYKAMVARDRGALGLLVTDGPAAKANDELVALRFDTSQSGTSIPVLSIGHRLRDVLMNASGKDLAKIETDLNDGKIQMGFPLGDVTLATFVDIRQEKRTGRNVLARLPADPPAQTAIAIGAHVDHLGHGEGSGSLARPEEKGFIHYGADDNASGVAGMLEIAQHLVDLKSKGKLPMKRNIIFAAWSGEELGLLGSDYFAATYGGKDEDAPLSPAIAAYLNMDMIGRLDKNVVIQGIGSSPVWTREIERRNAPVGLPIVTQSDSYLPTDATSFFLKQVPILSAFTGSHEDYHSPRDTAEKLNYQGMSKIAQFMGLMARGLVKMDEAPEYTAMTKPKSSATRGVIRAYLGTIPDYASGDVPGLKLSGVAKGGPAEQAGVRGGDIIVFLAGKKIENIYDYTYAIEGLKIGEETDIGVMRQDERLDLKITPGSRD